MNCSFCERDAMLIRKAVVAYGGINVPNVFLRNAEAEACSHCGTDEVVVRNIKKVHLAIAVGIALQPAKLSGIELRFLRKAMRMTLAECAERFGLATETFSRWENNRSPAQQTEKLFRINFLAFFAKDLPANLGVSELVDQVMKISLDRKRDFAMLVDVENLDRQAEYGNLTSPVFAAPEISHIEAILVHTARLARVRILKAGQELVAEGLEPRQNGEKHHACESFAVAA